MIRVTTLHPGRFWKEDAPTHRQRAWVLDTLVNRILKSPVPSPDCKDEPAPTTIQGKREGI